MDDFTASIAKFLSNPIVVHIHSIPPFSMEVFIMLVVCTVTFLLILEVNRLFSGLELNSRIKLKQRDQQKGLEGRESSCTILSKIIRKHQRPRNRRLSRIPSPSCIFTYLNRDNTIIKDILPKYSKIDQILAITPSEYIRKDRDRQQQIANVKQCIRSFSKMLSDPKTDEFQVSRECVRKNLELLQEHLSVLSMSDPICSNIMSRYSREISPKPTCRVGGVSEESGIVEGLGDLNQGILTIGLSTSDEEEEIDQFQYAEEIEGAKGCH